MQIRQVMENCCEMHQEELPAILIQVCSNLFALFDLGLCSFTRASRTHVTPEQVLTNLRKLLIPCPYSRALALALPALSGAGAIQRQAAEFGFADRQRGRL